MQANYGELGQLLCCSFEYRPESNGFEALFESYEPRTRSYWDAELRLGRIIANPDHLFYQDPETKQFLTGDRLPLEGDGYIHIHRLQQSARIVGAIIWDESRQRAQEFVLDTRNIQGRILRRENPTITQLELRGMRGWKLAIGYLRETQQPFNTRG